MVMVEVDLRAWVCWGNEPIPYSKVVGRLCGRACFLHIALIIAVWRCFLSSVHEGTHTV